MTPATVAVVRAAALRSNLQKVREAAPGCRVMAVVKANAYGHGLVPVARVLAGADAFAVARLEEARQLREGGITTRIVLLGGFVHAEEVLAAAALGLDLVVHSAFQVDILERLAGPLHVDLWLKADTGMGRLGVEPGQVQELRGRLERWLAGRGVLRLMTHLATADDPDNELTRVQLRCFGRLSRGWAGVSVANSAAILCCPAARQLHGGDNWVRPGLMLYGVSPLAGRSAGSLGLAPAMSFESRLIAVKRVARGCRVGYGGDWQAVRDSVIGVAAAGYADGYPWHTARDTPVLVGNARVPVIGRVSMDMISIDLTDVPDAVPGTRVVLWGDDPVVDEVARRAGTISYELLSGMSPRVPRELAG